MHLAVSSVTRCLITVKLSQMTVITNQSANRYNNTLFYVLQIAVMQLNVILIHKHTRWMQRYTT